MCDPVNISKLLFDKSTIQTWIPTVCVTTHLLWKAYCRLQCFIIVMLFLLQTSQPLISVQLSRHELRRTPLSPEMDIISPLPPSKTSPNRSKINLQASVERWHARKFFSWCWQHALSKHNKLCLVYLKADTWVQVLLCKDSDLSVLLRLHATQPSCYDKEKSTNKLSFTIH